MAVSLARWHLLGRSSNAASRANIGFGCLASLTHENLRLRLLRLSERLEPNRPEPASYWLNECVIRASLELASRATSSIVTIKSNSLTSPDVGVGSIATEMASPRGVRFCLEAGYSFRTRRWSWQQVQPLNCTIAGVPTNCRHRSVMRLPTAKPDQKGLPAPGRMMSESDRSRRCH